MTTKKNEAIEVVSKSDSARWDGVQARDVAANFVYAVHSTGVYCRPSCPSRRALRKNVEFFDTAIAAELSGFRACKRCKPQQSAASPELQAVLAMCRLLEDSDAEPSLRQLAAHVQLSESHAHRCFVKNIGLTPKRYREAALRRRVQQALPASRRVTDVIYAAGFGSASRFYERVEQMLGMSPVSFRAQGAEQVIHFAVGECSLGSILVAATERGVCAVTLGDEPAALVQALERRFARAELVGADQSFDAMVAQVVGLVETQGKTPKTLPLDVQGTVFQEKVWRALQAIPRGKTSTYSEIAKALDMPRAYRAVARACGDNPLAVLIPCHRVVKLDGSISGYRWGVARKQELLRREAGGK